MSSPSIRAVTVVGAGRMGHGIAQTFAQSGFPVTLHDLGNPQLGQAMAGIRENLRELSDAGLLTAAQSNEATARIALTTDLRAACATADLVIEAVFEDPALKTRLFAELDALSPERAILASNASNYIPSVMAAATKRPDRVLVMHYFYPPHLVPLVEIVPNPRTSGEAIQVVCDAVRATMHTPIVLKQELTSFLGNRLQGALMGEALRLVQEGLATPQQIDMAVREGLGRRWAAAGPFELAEVQAGWDFPLEVERAALAAGYPSPVSVPNFVRDMVARGELGAKTGKGFYDWSPDRLAAWRKRFARVLTTLWTMARQ